MRTSLSLLFLCAPLLFQVELCHGRGGGSTSNTTTSPCIASERNSLLKFKDGLTDPSNRLSSWSGQGCCQWRGVGCDGRTGHVARLDLRCDVANWSYVYTDLCLGGEVDPALADLKHLQYLDLSYNAFQGIAFPGFFGSFERLAYLNLSVLGLSGPIPPQLGNLSALRALDLSGTILLSTDSLAWVSGLTSLRYLNFDRVDLSKVEDWLEGVNNLPNLSQLYMQSTGITTITPRRHTMNVNLSSLTVLDLSGNMINSSVPSWIFNLSNLVYLDLGNSLMHGLIPEEFSKMSSLEVLILQTNNFEGTLPVRIISNLCHLRHLDISINQAIKGDIAKLLGPPSRSCGVQHSLEILDIWNNQISGNLLSSALWSFKNLKELWIGDNNLTGPVPEAIGQLSKLTKMDLSGNYLDGTLSRSHFANMTSLTQLVLDSYSPLRIDLSVDWIPPFQLQILHISNCYIGPRFPSWLQTQHNLTRLILTNVGISGGVPLSFWTSLSSDIEYLYLSQNNITGKLPNSMKFSKLQILDLSFNHLKGPFPNISCPKTEVLVLYNNSFSGPVLPAIGHAMPALKYLILSENLFSGSLPWSLCGLKDLSVLELSNNRISGTIPDCWNGTPELLVMNVENNGLTGLIPGSIGALNKLTSLHLNNNSLSGSLPLSLNNCTDLNTLDVGQNRLIGAVPAWVAANLTSLRLLRLRSNMFRGSIDPSLSRLSSLQILDLAHNDLSGTIPESFGNLSAMKDVSNTSGYAFAGTSYYRENMIVNTKGREYNYDKTLQWVSTIDLSGNHLAGVIPEQLTNLFGLKNLNLSDNLLSGGIPKTVGKLREIESLDLSRNRLSGPIPPSILSLNFLAHLNVSNNNLTGRIPTGSQLQTLTDPSIYEGNLDLCGPPLARRCDGGETIPSPGNNTRGNDDDDGNERLWFFVSMGLGFAVGFWLFCGPLVINNSWRSSYYRFLDGVYDRIYVVVATKLQKKR